jgi:hypothetical protein
VPLELQFLALQSFISFLLSWFCKYISKTPLNQVSAQLILCWNDQGANYDDPNIMNDIVTLDQASSGGLKIVSPEHTFTGAYLWIGNAVKSFKHFWFLFKLTEEIKEPDLA